MDFPTFETEFFLTLQNKNSKCLNLIDNNKDLVKRFLGVNANPKTIKRFINKISEIVLTIKSNLLPLKNYYVLIENVLNHPLLSKVKEGFINSKVLIKACNICNKDAAKWLSSTIHINPYIRDENVRTCLMYAAKNNYQFVIKQYIKDINCLDIEDKNGNNLLFYAVGGPNFISSSSEEDISNNHHHHHHHHNIHHFNNNNNNVNNNVNNINFLKELINSGIDINHVNHDGETVLTYCVKYGKNLQAIPFLLRHRNIDVNIPDNEGKTVAMYLTERGRYHDLLNLRKNNCNYNYRNASHQSVLSILLKKIYGGEKERHTIPLKFYIRILSILVSYQIDFNIPVDEDQNTAMMIALNFKDFETVKFCAGHLKNLDLSVKNRYGENVTSLCMKYGEESILKLLKNNPTFDYDYRDPVNQNTLFIYSILRNGIFLEELMEHHPDMMNAMNHEGENALILACQMNQIEMVKKLLQWDRINLYQQDHLGNTALHYAVERQHLELIHLLINKYPKSDTFPTIKNNEGKTVTDLVKASGHPKMIALITHSTCEIKASKKDHEMKDTSKMRKDHEMKDTSKMRKDHEMKDTTKMRMEKEDPKKKKIQEYLKPRLNNPYSNDGRITKNFEKIEHSIYDHYSVIESPYILHKKKKKEIMFMK